MLRPLFDPPSQQQHHSQPTATAALSHARRLLTLAALAALLLSAPALANAQPHEKHKRSANVPPNHPTPESFNGQPIPATQLKVLPVGLYLPVALHHALKAGDTRPGTPIQAYTTQRVPVAASLYMPRGVEILGTVVASNAGSAQSALTLRFTTLRYGGHDLPLHADALAIGNFSNVDDTYLPQTAVTDPTDSSPANWTTRQLGGDILTRQAWYGVLVNTRTQRVGFGDFNGVYADPQAPVDAPPTTPLVARLPRALGAFSSDASGLYGFDHDATLASGGGNITVTSPGRAKLRAADNLLLKTYDPAAPTTLATAAKPAMIPARPAPITQPDEMTPTATVLSTQAPSSPKL